MMAETKPVRHLLDLRSRYVDVRRHTIGETLANFEDRSRRSSLQDNLRLIDSQIGIIDAALSDERRIGALPVDASAA
ncbi:hypothetical protein E8L99_07755 [Phreatobacter aquaticus]|uniref:Uncharacterized protein n=1 Tax=Phreatobacter aquaticus TaxID=2570229 RepID=A0A4D7QK99_9HYPH|nr:hypothetical protein [Phreatobacter aquaticus]QCK85667.1 hypothetical protein E8L99_07755 [Phreatobacter aquaticus]